MKRKATSYLRRASKKAKIGKQIKTYVKGALKRRIENRELAINQSAPMFNAFSTQPWYINPWSSITRGVAENQYSGNDFYITTIEFGLYIESAINKDVDVNYAFIKTEYELPSAVWVVATAGDFFQFTGSASDNWRIDPAKARALRRGKISLKRSGFTGTMCRSKRFIVKMNKLMKINPQTGAIKGGGDYVLLVWVNIANNSGTDFVTTYSTSKVNFKDV